jgi:predicted outer membrane repeat protein
VVRVETGAGPARTAVPAVSFARYEYWFAKGGGGAAEKTAVNGVFELEEGSYTVTVKAFVAVEDAVPATEGTSDTFTITAGKDAGIIRVILSPVIGAGSGKLSFALGFPDGAVLDSFVLTRVGDTEPFDLAQAGTAGAGTFTGEYAGVGAGYWAAQATLYNSGVYVGKTEVVHIYNDMTTALNWTFTEENFAAIPVISAANDGPGTLRDALIRANAGQGGAIFIDLPEGGKVITLTETLPPISAEMLVIEGNGATLTQSGFTPGFTSQLMQVEAGVLAIIRRLHFTGGRTYGSGGAIATSGYLTLESCIFTDNRAGVGALAASGGAIISLEGSKTTIKACTFYNNCTEAGIGSGGAFAIENILGKASSNVYLTGNVFFGNTTPTGVSKITSGEDAIKSYGYNVSDLGDGTLAYQYDRDGLWKSGYDFVEGDVGEIAFPISPVNLKPLNGGAAGRLPASLGDDYPVLDFYGAPIRGGGAAGAVQTPAAGNYLDYGVTGAGALAVNTPPNDDGVYPAGAQVTLTATPDPGWALRYWTLDGTEQLASGDTFAVTMEEHRVVRAIFTQDATVTTEAELAAVLENQTDGDIISFGADIALTAVLPEIKTNITIEGNGHTLTRTFAGGSNTPLVRVIQHDGVRISGGGDGIVHPPTTLTVRRLLFKDGLSNQGGAIHSAWKTVNPEGPMNLILESCIFSGNRASSGGGAIYSDGDLSLRACTFYNNTAGAIYMRGGNLSLAGNLFLGNTGTTSVISKFPLGGSVVLSQGYNVSDKAAGADGSGYDFVTGDLGNAVFIISPANFKPLAGSAALNTLPAELPADYPPVDFYGNPIAANGAAGAVQTAAEGWHLDYGALPRADSGAVTPSSLPNADGVYTNNAVITLTAQEGTGWSFVSWLLDGTEPDTGANGSQLTLEMDAHKTVRAVFEMDIMVSNEAELRSALNSQADGNRIALSNDITLTSALPNITKSISIDGDGHFLSGDSKYKLLYINTAAATVSIKRLHFKDGNAATGGYGGAIRNIGTLSLESCIFSGNESVTYGGTIYTTGGSNFIVQGCTFYNNRVTGSSSSGRGGAIYRGGGTVYLTGNLFYGNTAGSDSYHIVYSADASSIVSYGYNVSDLSVGTGAAESGYSHAADLGGVTALPLSPASFKPLAGGVALNRLPADLQNYPDKDFYGAAISAHGAAGAAQTPTTAGYYLDYGSASGQGTVTVQGGSNADEIYSGSVTLKAAPTGAWTLGSWTVNGEAPVSGVSGNDLVITMDAHKTVRVTFVLHSVVNNEAELRSALNSQADGNSIVFNDNVALTSVLPNITKGMTIDGNGHTLTRTFAGGSNIQTPLLRISPTTAVTVTVKRLHFKDGLSYRYGGAMYIAGNLGNFVLESCIFSDNITEGYGGAIYFGSGNLTVKASAFYNNRVVNSNTSLTASVGGAIYRAAGTVYLTGNLFYGNTATKATNPYHMVYGTSGVTSGGYNVSDLPVGAGGTESGYALATGDEGGVVALPMSPVSFRPLSGRAALGKLGSIADYPTLDFYGRAISSGGAAGAAQETAAGWYLDYGTAFGAGTVEVTSGTANADGLYTGSVTLTATPGNAYSQVSEWTEDNESKGSNATLNVTMNAHKTVRAAFKPSLTVHNEAGLYAALEWQTDGDTININADIALTGGLPSITRNIVIEGNGHTLTQTYATVASPNTQLLSISVNSTAIIRRLRFTGGKVLQYGGAISNAGTLTLESCIFSGNEAERYGGAIYNSSAGSLTIKGCSFHNNKVLSDNSSQGQGGAIYFAATNGNATGAVCLKGNLFSGNTALNGAGSGVAFSASGGGGITSQGYNVSDKAEGLITSTYSVGSGNMATASGYLFATGDVKITGLTFDENSKPSSSAGLKTLTSLDDFPATYFNGSQRQIPATAGAMPMQE